MIELTEDQRRELRGTQGEPARVIDPETKQEYVLVPAEVYQRVRNVFVGENSEPDVMYSLLAEIQPEDWEDASVYGIRPGNP